MDAKDLELITLLSQRGRWEPEGLSSEMGISSSNVDRRMRLLKKEGQLKGFSAYFDRRSFGYDTTYVKLHYDMRSLDRIIEEVSQMPQIAMIYPNMDDFMWIEIVHWDTESLRSAIRKIERIAFPNTVSAHMTPRFPDEVPEPPKGKDLKVLKFLIKDGRIDLDTIGSLIGTSPDDARERVERLRNAHGVKIKPLVQEDMVTTYPAFSVIVELKKGCRLDSCFSDLKQISKGSWDIIALEQPTGMWMRFFGKDLHAMDTMLERYRREKYVENVTVVLPDTVIIKRSVDLDILSK